MLAAMCSILPWDFWKLTPRELEIQAKGYEQRQEHLWYRTAWLACHLPLAQGVKKGTKLSPDKLLGKKKPREKTPSES